MDTWGIQQNLTEILVPLVFASVFFWTFFDRKLNNHVYLFWYGLWNIFLSFEALAICLFDKPFRFIIPTISMAGLVSLYTAAKKFTFHREKDYIYYLMGLGLLIQLIGGWRLDTGVVLTGLLIWFPVYIYNYLVVSNFASDNLKNLLLLSTSSILFFRLIYVFTGPQIWSYSLMATSRIVLILVTIGVHLQRLQHERDIFKTRLLETRESLKKIDQIEANLMKLVSECNYE